MNPFSKLILILLPLAILAGCRSTSPLKTFTTDGCSSFPNGTLKHKELWLACCTEHDRAYWQGGTYSQRLEADKELRQCVAQVGEPAIANLMLGGVRVGGTPILPTRFRWGYGWDYPRWYGPLSAEEKALVDKAIQAEQ
ncbi:MAG: hypothetical protein KKD73_13305 [Proteobacteria bacterium]|nr:hypothetical protein [Pseudomonadota bacterium]MBU1639504.1 hypothetical protein [Pseudomonadota bacterium]